MTQVRIRNWNSAMVVASALLGSIVISSPGSGQTAYRAPRTADGKPDLSGIWQAVNTANWDLEPHNARPGPLFQLGAAFAVPAGLGVVEGGEIPYKPEALAQKQTNAENWMQLDPEIKCFMLGVPRSTYAGYPFQIVQTPTHIMIAYEFAAASRIVYMNSTEEAPIDSWMGWSRGRWQGETLVIDVTGFNGQSWFDRAGNYQSEQLHVVERYTAVDKNLLHYEATIEDPQLFTRPWKISMPLYRRVDPKMQLLEYKCVPFAEELLYRDLTKKN